MFKRQTSGSVVCASCGNLVGVNDQRCFTCGRWNPGLWGYAPTLRRLGQDLGFVPLVIWSCAGLYLATLVASGADALGAAGPLGILAPNPLSLFLFGASGALPVFGYGRWWTVVSAGWLHAGILHIVFNMLWVRQLGPATAELYGAGRMVIIYTVAGLCGFVLSSFAGAYLGFMPGFLRGAQFTVGASAPIFGLLGALVYYGRRTGSSMVRREALHYAVVLFVFGLIMTGVDNYAHAGGFLGGYLVSLWMDPMKPERIDHILWALACLLAAVLSVAASLAHGWTLR